MGEALDEGTGAVGLERGDLAGVGNSPCVGGTGVAVRGAGVAVGSASDAVGVGAGAVVQLASSRTVAMTATRRANMIASVQREAVTSR